MLRIRLKTGVQKLLVQKFLYIYKPVRNAKIFHSLDILNTDSQAAMAQSVEHATAAPKVPSSSLGHCLHSLVKKYEFN